jgi:hypothetical protein
MTTITIQFDRPRSNRLAVIAMSLGVSLVLWAEQRSRSYVGHEEHARRVAVAAGIRDREHAALRAVLPR